MKKVSAIILILLIIFTFFVFQNREKQIVRSGKTQIAASFYPMYFLVSSIVGNKMDVINITPAGAEPHDYDLTPQDIVNIQDSRLLVLNGVVEPWRDKIKQNLINKDVQLLVSGSDLTTQTIEENGQIVVDPHVWLSPELAKGESEKILSAVTTIDPKNIVYYQNNEKILEKQLDDLNSEYKAGLTNCATRTFVTSHAAFGYLARDYNLKQIAIAGLTPEEEPSLQKLAQVTDLVRKNNVKYIFFETLASPKLAETIANEVGAGTLVLDPIEGISKENLDNGVNYLTLMKTNLQNLRKALLCQ